MALSGLASRLAASSDLDSTPSYFGARQDCLALMSLCSCYELRTTEEGHHLKVLVAGNDSSVLVASTCKWHPWVLTIPCINKHL